MNEKALPTKTDPSGLQTLEQFADAKRFNQWLFRTLLPFCKGKILEAGSGIGNISQLLLEHQFHLTASDLRQEYCIHLREKFKNHKFLDEVVHLDLSNEALESKHPGLLEKFDTVITSNVIEHIKDDLHAIRNCKKMLADKGQLIILVPAFQRIYNNLDKELGHFRRYNAKQLAGMLKSEGLKVIHTEYFNAAGLIGWFFSGKLLKNKIIPGSHLKLFEKLVPIIKVIDKITFHKAGLSVIAVAAKP